MRTRVVAVFVLTLLGLPVPVRPDHLVVSRETVVRDAPRREGSRIIAVEPGATLRLLPGDRVNGYYAVSEPQSGRSGWVYKTFVRRYPGDPPLPPAAPVGSVQVPLSCAAKLPMRVRFYDVGQALAVLVDLPDGRKVLVDAGESPIRAGCGDVCRTKHEHLLERLERDLGGSHVALMWVTHQHSDHVGGAVGVLNRFHVQVYADNGEALGKAVVKKARDAAQRNGARIVAITPGTSESPIVGQGDALRIRAVVPSEWPGDCEEDPNSCSIGLLIEYCASSVLFTGDAEESEEARLGLGGPVTLLQVGHHGSDTSSSGAFLHKVSPRYAVISAGRPGEGLNDTYCHPREVTVEELTATLGGARTATLTAFDGGASCRGAEQRHWRNVRASERLWATSRDGDITLVTTGDGVFDREGSR